jgi:hypothetical protein
MRVYVVRYDSGRSLALALLLIDQTLKAQAATAAVMGFNCAAPIANIGGIFDGSAVKPISEI